ncbi:sirohydrochlorin cobaltochelatase [Nonomuraea coxensis DSM 45129]|uniref:Sirohydrochlorin cobaltochelatase n=1 Tax=Nonomuraea coxensis DSM 45129 TaxID=1122611 RepID=A0ABX8U5D2_9ACTN|nr:CbiX/SirB N-terminal domain-containing protein [Nonomuraea coxensis]QYC42843.1 sirohydrochlorin cobaltochelatase [Nonomuraea coxensis DSM 45129]
MTPAPALVLAAHGTRSPAGEAALAALAETVRRARPGRRVELSHLEISSPLLADVLPAVRGPVVVVPLLLAGGYHVHIDLPEIVAACRPDAVVAGALGPHRLLTGVLARRLGRAGLRATDAVVLGAAGSSDPAGLADVRAAARMLAVRLARPVTAAFASAGSPSLEEAMERLAATPAARVAIASYVLAPGFFHDRLAAASAGPVSDPLGADPDVAALVWHRHDEAVRAARSVPQTAAGAEGAGSSRSSRTTSRALASRDGQVSAPTNIST